MSYVSNAKAVEIAHELAWKLGQRMSTFKVTEGVDADNCPTIAINDGTPAAGEANFFIKVANITWNLVKDSLGNAAGSYGPEVIMIATEANSTSASVADILSLQNILDVVGECAKTGCVVQWWQEANGTVPADSTFDTASKLKATWYPSLKYTITSAQ